MYPHLALMCSEKETLVNSERFQYLVEVDGGSAKNDMKPDFWISLIRELLVMKLPEGAYFVPNCLYGCPLVNCAFTVDCFLDAKIGKGALTLTDIGKLFWYLNAFSTAGNINPRGAFYNSSEYVFAEFKDGHLSSICRCLWKTKGSLTSLAKLLRPAETNGTVCALQSFLSVGEAHQIDGVLGRGRFGCVFDAKVGGVRCALKVVAYCADHPQSSAEYQRMCDMHRSHPQLVAAVVEGSFVSEPGRFTYYLLSDVGHGGNHQIKARDVVVKLAALHATGETHGDPRVQNIIELADGSLKWIDLSVSGSVLCDITVLFESIFGLGVLDGSDISHIAQNYINGVTMENLPFTELQELIERVYDIAKG
jgi:hypothetical protein